MPTQAYKTADGKRVPGVTTVIGSQLAWNKRPLMYWAWEQGRDGHDFMATREAAADLGTVVHALIERELRGSTVSNEELVQYDQRDGWKDQIENALLAFYAWRDAFRLEPTGSEVALVSESHRFGGTIDYPVYLRGNRCILDLKTSKDVYADHRVQVAAYGHLWNEMHPADPVTGGYHLLRVGKGDGGFAHHYWPSLEREWEVFLLLRRLHELYREFK